VSLERAFLATLRCAVVREMLLREVGVDVAEIAASPSHEEGKTVGQYQLQLGQLFKAGLAKREKDSAAFRDFAVL
jgi:hypothetical protein